MSNIEDRLDRIERKLDTLLAALKTNSAQRPSVNGAGAPAAAQDIDADIDGPRGDPEVRFMPKRWTGADCKGMKFSACEPDFLDMLADAYEWFAQRDDESGAVDKNGTPKSRWSRLDAARARAWASRLRGNDGGGGARRARPAPAAPANGRKTAPSNGHASSDYGDDNEIPF